MPARAWRQGALERELSGRAPSPCVAGAVLLLGAFFFLTSCRTPSSPPVTGLVSLPERFSRDGQVPFEDAWWTGFEDAELNRLEEQALARNFSLRSARDRLRQARALASRSGAQLRPSLDASSGVSRDVRERDTGPGGAEQRTYETDLSLGLAAAYEVDLWGRLRSLHHAARLDAEASEEALYTAAVTLSARVADVWFSLLEQRAQLRLIDDQIQTNRASLDVITEQFRSGIASATDVLQQRQLVESTRAERIVAESGLAILEHQLSVLVGRAPGTWEVPDGEQLPALPVIPALGVPSTWLRRRPDLRAAERRVRAADERVAAAVTDRFPRLSLTLGASTNAEEVRDLFDNWFASLAANLVGPVIDGGYRKAEVVRTRAAAAEALNTYADEVLNALKEVEDAMVREAHQADYVASLREQLRLSREATDRTRESYLRTGNDFIRYLTTLTAYQRLQRQYLSARRELLGFRVALYRAAGVRVSPFVSEDNVPRAFSAR